MKKKSMICLLIFMLVCSLGVYTQVYADNASDKQDELNEINDQKKDVKNDLAALTASIKEQQAEVDRLKASMEQKQGEIEKAQADIDKTIKDIDKRQNGLNKRLRTMYKNGSVGYLDVLLGSSSVSEFLTNLELIQRIYRGDEETLRTLEEQQKELEKKRAALKHEKEELDKQKSEAEEKQSALQSDKDALQAKLDELNAEADRISDEIARMQDHDKKYEGGQFLWPTTSTYITSPFGFRIHPVTGVYTGHTGIDIGVGMNSPVYAAADGRVIVAGSYGGYGYAVVIDHGSGISTLYGHNSSVNVSVGQNVSRGQVIASSGSTGVSTGPHLHFEVRVNGAYVDPMQYF
ncbi:murein hydrolase activator EnvC family protein [Ihubacter sp. rT4E-8]|uniref:murein hydrolase activator EnvC family protein n=1 Tax=unclassified Ihubacter TaxID=2633299 RepID=UPI00137A1EBC